MNNNIVSNVNSNGSVVTPNIGQNNVNLAATAQNNVVVGKNNNKVFVWVGVIVGFALLIAFVLLGFLLSGTIANRNRLTCTMSTPEDGYNYTIKRYYTFADGIMKRLDLTYTFNYNNTFTEDMYNDTFSEIINKEQRGSTKYGLGTNISKSGNVVTITAFQPSYWNESYKTVKDTNKTEGYTCK